MPRGTKVLLRYQVPLHTRCAVLLKVLTEISLHVRRLVLLKLLTEISLHARRLVLPELCYSATEERNDDPLQQNTQDPLHMCYTV